MKWINFAIATVRLENRREQGDGENKDADKKKMTMRRGGGFRQQDSQSTG